MRARFLFLFLLMTIPSVIAGSIDCDDCNDVSCVCEISGCDSSGIARIWESSSSCEGIWDYEVEAESSTFVWYPDSDNNHYVKFYDSSGYCVGCTRVRVNSYSPNGGGGYNPGDYPSEESWPSISSGSFVNWRIYDPPLKVLRVQFRTLKRLTDVEISINALSDRPSGVTDPDCEVCQYFEVTKDNIQNSDITNLLIYFRVERSWLEDEDVNPGDIVLKKFSGSSWKEFETWMSGYDDDYYYYRSLIDGFSYFVICGFSSGTGTTTTSYTTTPYQTSTAPYYPTTTPTPGPTTTPIRPSPDKDYTFIYILVGILVLIMVVVAGVFIMGAKRKSGEELIWK